MTEEGSSVFGVPFGDIEHAYPEVFNTMPPQPKVKRPGQLTEQQVRHFFEHGYVQVDDYFDKPTLDRCKQATEQLIDEFSRYLHKAGAIKSTYEDYGLYQRLTHVEKDLPGTTMILAKAGYLPQAYKDLWSHPRLLNVMEQLLGTRDVKGNPVWNLRNKVPQNDETTVPWHQDIGYTDNDAHRVLQVTAWIPLLDSNVQNGCMQVVRNGHKTGRIVPHYACWKETNYVEMKEDEMESVLGVNLAGDVVTCEVPYGGVLFLSNILPHRSLANLSNDIRWSFDFRWQRMDTPTGFHGMREGIQLCSADDTDFKPDWAAFNGGHNPTFKATLDTLTKNGTSFDHTILGPWYQKWKIVNKNVHVRALEKKLADPNFKFVWHEKPKA